LKKLIRNTVTVLSAALVFCGMQCIFSAAEEGRGPAYAMQKNVYRSPATASNAEHSKATDSNAVVVEAGDSEANRYTLPEPEREGYHFLEWNTKRDGSGDSYFAGETIRIRNMTLYAIWEKEADVTATPSNAGKTMRSEESVEGLMKVTEEVLNTEDIRIDTEDPDEEENTEVQNVREGQEPALASASDAVHDDE
jgi:hypothetical protein